MIRSSGDFPWLKTDDYFEFPDAESVDEDGIVGVGGNLSPGMLLSAYRQGVFPWFSPDDPIIWWSPDPRFVLMVAEIHVSRSMNKLLKAGSFSFTVDRAFSTVIRACASAPRKGQSGTWITEDMELGYCRLHELGYAHSCEVWQADQRSIPCLHLDVREEPPYEIRGVLGVERGRLLGQHF